VVGVRSWANPQYAKDGDSRLTLGDFIVAQNGEVRGDDLAPVRALSLEEANASLRGRAKTLVFGEQGLKQGIVHTVQVGSNAPVEDTYSVGMAPGVGGSPTLFAGIFDGHAYVLHSPPHRSS
jgi:hypothetical protein